jgi:hypothetical protein
MKFHILDMAHSGSPMEGWTEVELQQYYRVHRGPAKHDATITNGIAAPPALAIDSLHNVSVQNSDTHVTI